MQQHNSQLQQQQQQQQVTIALSQQVNSDSGAPTQATLTSQQMLTQLLGLTQQMYALNQHVEALHKDNARLRERCSKQENAIKAMATVAAAQLDETLQVRPSKAQRISPPCVHCDCGCQMMHVYVRTSAHVSAVDDVRMHVTEHCCCVISFLSCSHRLDSRLIQLCLDSELSYNV